MATQETLHRIQRDLADAVGVGLRSADPTMFRAMAEELRELGLEGPAQAAERLVASVGPERSAVDGLDAFARLQQSLAAVQLRLVELADLSGQRSLEVPGMPSLRVDAQNLVLRPTDSLWDYPSEANPESRYAYLIRVAQRLQVAAIAPEGDGLAVWSNLQAGGLVVEVLGTQPRFAVPFLRQAYKRKNPVIYRNVIRVLARICVPRAPLPDHDPAMRLLAPLMRSKNLLVAQESLAVFRAAKGLPVIDPQEPYPGADGKGEIALATCVNEVRKAGGKVTPSDPWFISPRKFGIQGLEEIQGPRGEVQKRLSHSLRYSPDKQERLRALHALMFVCDPVAIPTLREALNDQAVEVRKDALWGLGVLGDDFILPLCRHHLTGKALLANEAAMALGPLADSRGFPLLWSAYERNVATWRAAESLGMLREASNPMLTRLGLNPTLMARSYTPGLLETVCGAGAPDAVLAVLEATGDPRARKILLKPLALPDAKGPAKAIAEGLRDRLLGRIGQIAVPLSIRLNAAESLRSLAPDDAEALLAPVLRNLPRDEAAAFGAAPRRIGFLRRRRGPDAG